jgi:hypothetical protein
LAITTVDYKGISALLKVKIAESTKRTPRILLASDENPECVENESRVSSLLTYRASAPYLCARTAHSIAIFKFACGYSKSNAVFITR